MAKQNERGAGRKKKLSKEQIWKIKERHNAGESVTSLAKEYGISRQALSGYLNRDDTEQEQIYKSVSQWIKLNQQFRGINVADYAIRMDFMCEEECCTTILVDYKEQRIAIHNETDEILHRAFGIKAKPTWGDYEEFIESRCFPRTREGLRDILKDLGLDFYDPLTIIERTKGKMAEDLQWIRLTYLKA